MIWDRGVKAVNWLVEIFGKIPYSLVAVLGRFSIAAIFWKSGQTKVEGLQIDLISGKFEFGLPRMLDSTIFLFREEYKVPVIPPEWAAYMAATAEHVFPILILAGFATRFSALALLGMTLVIQTFVYPDAYPTHGVWATVLLLLIAMGPGKISFDHWIARRFGTSS